jgi:hypothetical protein
MVWTMLIAMSALSFFSGALYGNRFTNGYLVGLAVGLACGVPNFLLWERLVTAIEARVRDLPVAAQERRIFPFYVLALAWTPIAAAIGHRITLSISRLL